MMKIRVKSATLDILLLLIVLEEWPMMNHQIYTVVKYGIIFYMLLKHSTAFLNLAMQKSTVLMPTMLLLLFTVLSTVSTMQYTDKVAWAISAMMNGLSYVAFFVALFSIAPKCGIAHILKVIVSSLIIVLLCTDILILVLPYNLQSPSEQYLIGNKFAVSYYHCFAMVVAKAYAHGYTGKRNLWVKNLPAILGLLSIVICATVHCSTGLLISIFSLFMILLPYGLKKFVCNRRFVSALLLIVNVLIFGSAKLFENPIVQAFVVNVLGKTGNFTGRFRIYGVLDSVIAQKPLLGFGYNTVTTIIKKIVGYGNAQNGIYQLIIQYGYLGTSVLLTALFMFAGKENKKQKDVLELYVMLYALVIASTVEISLSTLFVFVIALIGAAHFYYFTRRNTSNAKYNISDQNI